MSIQISNAEVQKWKEMFDKVNADEVAQGYEAMAFSDTDYYADQIWNLTNEGDQSEEWCEALADALLKLEKNNG